MLEPKFTKGEWIYEVRESGLRTVSCDKHVVSIFPHLTTLEKDTIANAKLMAAAPELFEALKTMMIGLEDVDIPNDGHSTIHTGYTMDIILQAKAAMIKAVGAESF